MQAVKKLYNYMIGVVCIVLITCFFVCIHNTCLKKSEIQEYVNIANSLTAEQVLQKHFDFQNNKKLNLIKYTVTDKNAEIDFSSSKSHNINIISVREIGYDSLAKRYLPNSTAYFDVTSFDVEFEISPKRNESDQNIIKYLWRYILVKETENSPWLIDSWGVNF